jgi:hypothetical protein
MGRYAKSTDLNGSKVFVQLPKGTTTEQPSSPYGGMIRFNTSLNKLEYYNGTSWLALSGGAGGAATITVDTFTILDEDSSGTPRDSYSPLSLTPAADQNVLVFLGGVYQPPSAYNINTDSTSPYIKMLALVSGDIGSSLVVIHGFDSV